MHTVPASACLPTRLVCMQPCLPHAQRPPAIVIDQPCLPHAQCLPAIEHRVGMLLAGRACQTQGPCELLQGAGRGQACQSCTTHHANFGCGGWAPPRPPEPGRECTCSAHPVFRLVARPATDLFQNSVTTSGSEARKARWGRGEVEALGFVDMLETAAAESGDPKTMSWDDTNRRGEQRERETTPVDEVGRTALQLGWHC